MKRDVVWADSALRDLSAVVRYLARENPRAATVVADRIDRAATRLGDMATGRRGRVGGTYEKVVRGMPYIIAYEIERLQDGAERVTILHVIHGARDWTDDTWPKT